MTIILKLAQKQRVKLWDISPMILILNCLSGSSMNSWIEVRISRLGRIADEKIKLRGSDLVIGEKIY